MDSHIEAVKRRQQAAQAREDAAAIEARQVRRFLRSALPDDAVLPASYSAPIKKTVAHVPRVESTKIVRMHASPVIRGVGYVPSACLCDPWDECTCAKR